MPGAASLPSRPASVHAGAGFSGIHLCCVSNSLVPRLLASSVETPTSRYTQEFHFGQKLAAGDDAGRVESGANPARVILLLLSALRPMPTIQIAIQKKWFFDKSNPSGDLLKLHAMGCIVNQLPMNLHYLSAIFG